MNENSSVICIGEILIDFFCTDVDIDLVKGKRFEKHAGGAPANVCAAIVKLGGRASFVGKVGKDPFGLFLKNTLNEVNVDTSMLVMDNQNPTTLAFVSLKADGERDFVFNRGADAYLREDELDKGRLRKAGILHFGSATALLEGTFRDTYLNVIEATANGGQLISFDPNYRSDLWEGRKAVFTSLARKVAAKADFIKVSDEELRIISETKGLTAGVQYLHDLGADTVAVTLGKRGTLISNGKNHEIIPSIEIDAIDSTGAGDAFVGAMLYQLSKAQNPKKELEDFNKLRSITALSNKVGAVVCTKVGAISALPSLEEVLK
ncbi:carbohydrate kinase [Bacillus sp. H-16]|uniref:carbohydrate kinase family protein n=1 Tax=Alteribacter salitolerans TaxID=2912333 RepID=UPI001966447B|nr:carbohydrate kinase [Alteribacter salitolerans]MBM7094980.1 carbohydrate kinase [Alteribacter salitolerans]